MKRFTAAVLPLSIALVACATRSPAGEAPSWAKRPESASSCRSISGIYPQRGKAFRDGIAVENEEATVYEMVQGCWEAKECKWPVLQKPPVTFRIEVSLTSGMKVELRGGQQEIVGTMHIPATGASCTTEGLSIVLHDGWKQARAGSWTAGREKVSIVLRQDAEGRLIAKRESEQLDIFWFGVPASTVEGTWYVFSPTEAALNGH